MHAPYGQSFAELRDQPRDELLPPDVRWSWSFKVSWRLEDRQRGSGTNRCELSGPV